MKLKLGDFVIDPAKRSRNIGPEEALVMFRYYCDNGSMAGVAKQFRRSRTSIDRLAQREDWKSRAAQVKATAEQQVQQQAIRKQLSLATKAEGLLDQVYRGLERMVGDKNFKPSVHDFVDLGKLVSQLGGGAGIAGGQVVDEVKVNKALAVIERLTPAVVKDLVKALCTLKPAKTLSTENTDLRGEPMQKGESGDAYTEVAE